MDKTSICKIRDVYRAIASLEDHFQKTFGLNINEVMVLCTLNSRDNITSSEIAQTLGLANSNASKVIGSVENKSLIKRNMNKSDKRQMHFSLSKKGLERLAEIRCEDICLPPLLQDILKE